LILVGLKSARKDVFALLDAMAFFAAIAFLSALNRGEDGSIEERAFKKVSSSCLSIAPDAGALYTLLSFLHHIFNSSAGFLLWRDLLLRLDLLF
jgi:hypothetical protein